ncbi:MAG: hypothetical protein JXR76_02700 [Deltaproteobacteria bacterium]|nr:hypothetical protein [Deltaproteobacteria bacterium]
MKKNRIMGGIRIWLVTILVLGAIASGITLYVKFQKEKLEKLKANITRLKEEHVPMRFMVESRGDGYVVAKVKLYDMDGNEIGVAKSTLKGESLFLDFVTVPLEKKYLTFPQAIFTDAVPAQNGIALFPLYDRNGFPQVFAAEGINDALKNDLSTLFSKVKQSGAVDGSFGSAVHDIKEFRAFDVDVVYRVIARLKGGLEIVEDDQ